MFRLKVFFLLMFVLATSGHAYENQSMRGQKPTACDFDPNCDHNEVEKKYPIPEPMPTAFVRVIDYVDPNAAALGYFPAKGQDLRLDAMAPYQKVKGGYMIEVSNVYGTIPGAVAFLQTDHDYQQGTLLNEKSCKVMGIYEYISLDGFKRSVYKLKEISE